MRLYSRQFTNRFADRRVKKKTETRDGLLWDIDTVNYTCRVRIQGSNTFVIAHYPRNWVTTPYWLKPGNAVRVLHRSGVRGYTEVIGEGRAISSPITGSPFGVLPDAAELPDVVYSGAEVTAATGVLGVVIEAGYVRVDGEVVAITVPEAEEIVDLDDPATMTLGDNTLMGANSFSLALDAAPAAGYFRYDVLVVGADGVVDYIAGTPATSDPEYPEIPAGHVQIGDYILVAGGTTALEDEDIGTEWATRTPTLLTTTVQSDPLAVASMWVRVYLYDQYGAQISGTDRRLEVAITSGNGQLYHSSYGYGETVVISDFESYVQLTYYADETLPDQYIMLTATLPEIGLTGTTTFEVTYVPV